MRDWRTTLPCALALLLTASCGGGGGTAGGTPQQPADAVPLVVVRATSGEIRVVGPETYELILDGVEESSTVTIPEQGSAPVRTDDLVAAWRESAGPALRKVDPKNNSRNARPVYLTAS